MGEQALAQVGQVSVRVSRRRHPLVYLRHVNALPRHVFLCHGAQHLPGRVAATDGHDEAATRGDSRPCLHGDDRGAFPGDRVGVVEYLDFHFRT